MSSGRENEEERDGVEVKKIQEADTEGGRREQAQWSGGWNVNSLYVLCLSWQ